MKRATINMSGNKTIAGLAEAIQEYLKANEHMKLLTAAAGDIGYTILAAESNGWKLITGTNMAVLVTLKPTGEGNVALEAEAGSAALISSQIPTDPYIPKPLPSTVIGLAYGSIKRGQLIGKLIRAAVKYAEE